jgi:hypothetical protein
MGLRLPRITYLSVAVILAGIVIPQAYWHWLQTRNFVALDQPVSLSRGEIRTADFSLNIRSWYHITLWVDSDFSGCQSGFSHLALTSRSTVYNNGHAIESSEGLDRYLGHFYADKKGRYNVSIQITSDPSCLNDGHPRIGIWTESGRSLDFYNELRNAGQVIAIAGIGLLAFSLSKIKPRITAQALSYCEGTGHACYFPRKRAPRARFPLLPPFGLSYTLVLSSILVPTFLMFMYAWGWDRPSMGIRIYTSEEALLSARSVSFDLPPLVRLEQVGNDRPPKLYLNSKPVRWDELGEALTKELELRPDWVVYVDADGMVSWSDVIGAMDIVRGRHAKIVLLARKKKKISSR